MAKVWLITGSASGLGRQIAEAVLALVLVQFVSAYVFRSERRSLGHRPFANR